MALVVKLLETVAHIEHRNALETRVHTILTLPAFLLALVLIVEVWVPLWVLKA